MNTTNLFVELIVIGISAMIWVCLLVFSVFGYDWIPKEKPPLELPILIPLLAITYLLGIVTDRVSDFLFETFWKGQLVKVQYPDGSTEYEDRRLVYVKAERLANLLEYGRSRLRICRGWALNTLLILVSLNIFCLQQLSTSARQGKIILWGNFFLLLLFGGLCFSWRQLTTTDLRKVRDQAKFLRALECANPPESTPSTK